MTRRLRTPSVRRLSLVAAIIVALGTVAAAWGYFSSGGAGSARASIGSVNPPSSVGAQQNGGSVSITWSGASLSTGGSVQGYRVKRSDGATICGSPTLVSGLSCTDSSASAGNSYAYTVTAVYHTFSASSASGSLTFLAAPTLSSKPSTPSANASPSFGFTGGGGTGYECQLDGGGFTTCASPSAYSSLSDGSHAFKVHATKGGATGPDTTYTWTIDASAPAITAQPADPSNSSSATFSFNHPSYNGFKCQLDGGAFTDCTSANTYAGLGDGSHTFAVEAVDGDGAATKARSYTWTIDTTAPVVALTKVNGAPVTFPYSTNANVTSIGGSCGTATGDSATVSWSVSGGSTQSGTAACSSGSWSAAVTTLSSESAYTLAVSQTDSAGNAGASGGKSLSIDKTAPVVTLTKVNGAAVTFPYSTNANVTSIGGSCGSATGDSATVGWSVSGGSTQAGTAACASGSWSATITTLATESGYTVEATQNDTAGNTGDSGAKSITLDKTAPATSITAPSNNGVALATPTISGRAGTATGDATTVTVKIYNGTGTGGTVAQTINNVTVTGGSWSTTASALTLGNTYTAQVIQTDAAGNSGTATSTFTVSSVTITSPATGSATKVNTPATGGTTSSSANVIVKVYSGTSATGTPVQTSPNVVPSGGTWSWTAGARADGVYTVQAQQVVGSVTYFSSANTFTVDTTSPSGGSVSYTNGYATPPPQITLNNGTDSGSGIATTQLQRQSATLSSAGACGSYGSFATIATNPTSPYSDTSLLSGNCYKYQYIVTDNAGNSTTYASASALKVDTTPPAVSSINRSNPATSATNAASVQFAVTFSESVTGVDASDFSVSASGPSGASISSVSGSGSSYTVTVSTGSGSGTLGLGLVDNDSIVDLAGNPLGGTGGPGTGGDGSFAGQSYTIDKIVPSGGSITYSSGYATPSVAITLNAGTDGGGSGLGTTTLQRASAPLSNNSCGTFGSFATIATNPASPYSDSPASANCYKYQYLVADNAGNSTTYTSANQVKVDTTAPASSMTALSTYHTATSFTVNWSASDAASGLASVALYVKGPQDAAYSQVGSPAGASGTSASGAFSYSANEGDGLYSFYTRATDVAGNVEPAPAAADTSTTLDTTPPAGLASWTTANGGSTVARIEQGDTITLNFSEPIDATSIITPWNNPTQGQNVWVKLADSGTGTSANDTITICAASDTSCSAPLSIGTINLKGDYIDSASGNGVALFQGSGSGAKSMIAFNAQETTLTLTLGIMSSNTGTLVTQTSASQGIWSGWSFKDLAGNQASATASATQATAQKQF